MPELPEVETVARGLRRSLIGCTIAKAKIRCEKIARENPGLFTRIIKGKKIKKIERYGKQLLIYLSDDWLFWCHLMMTGHLFVMPKSQPVQKPDRVLIIFEDDSRELRFHDVRRFGHFRLIRTKNLDSVKEFVQLGPDALEVSRAQFITIFRKPRRMIKPALLDQRLVCGLGNIYADEILFAAKIHPCSRTDTLLSAQLARLYSAMQKILGLAIRWKGTSVDSYSDVNNQPGQFQHRLKVYGRNGEKCYLCQSKIQRIIVAQRSSHFCPTCQPKDLL